MLTKDSSNTSSAWIKCQTHCCSNDSHSRVLSRKNDMYSVIDHHKLYYLSAATTYSSLIRDKLLTTLKICYLSSDAYLQKNLKTNGLVSRVRSIDRIQELEHAKIFARNLFYRNFWTI